MMLSYKSFVDVLFILLLGTLVMLTQSVQVGAVDTVLATLGAGGISPVKADEVQVVAVAEGGLITDGRTVPDVEQLVPLLEAGDAVLLVTVDVEVTHHRVLAVWSALQERGIDVKLGAKPRHDSAADPSQVPEGG